MRKSGIVKFLALVALAIVFSYCKKPTEFKEIDADNLFSMEVPVYFHPTTELLPVTASNIHQYADSVGKICLMIFDTSRNGFDISSLKAFYDTMTANPVMDSVTITKPELVMVGNDSTYKSELTGKLSNLKMFGEIEAIAVQEHFYFIITWSTLDRREQLKPDMYKMLSSFHDISHAKK